jgi:hypothetical protein
VAMAFMRLVTSFDRISYYTQYCGVYATNKTGSSSDDWIY